MSRDNSRRNLDTLCRCNNMQYMTTPKMANKILGRFPNNGQNNELS